MGSALGSEFKINYCDIVILFSICGFVIDSWVWLLGCKMTLAITLLIINEYVSVFKNDDNMQGYMFLFSFILGTFIFIFKKLFERYTLGQCLAHWGEMGPKDGKKKKKKMTYKEKFKKGWVVLLQLVHYGLNLVVLTLPVWAFYFTEFWGYLWWIPQIWYWIFVIGAIVFYIPYTLMGLLRMVQSENITRDPKDEGKWMSVKYNEGYKVRYRGVIIFNAVSLFVIYCAYLVYLFERLEIIKWFTQTEHSLMMLYAIGFSLIGILIIVVYVVGGLLARTISKPTGKGAIDDGLYDIEETLLTKKK